MRKLDHTDYKGKIVPYRNKVIIISIVCLFSCVNIDGRAIASDGVITVYYDKAIGFVNDKVFGNNFIGYDPMTIHDLARDFYGYSDYGGGVWDPKKKKPVKTVVRLAKEAGITILRFPGGCGAHRYNWKNTIGKKRKHFLYGIDEFLKTCSEIGAEAVITVSYFAGDERDATDLIEYLNSPDDGKNPNDGIDWAAERAKNGHPGPYHVQYFEIGNEEWHGDHQDVKNVLPEEYAQRYLQYYEAMKQVDPSIKIGAILYTKDFQEWNKRIMEIIREKIDFGIIHIYPTPAYGKELEAMDPREIISSTLAIPLFRDEYYMQEALKILREKSGKDVPLAITEYNGNFVQEKPVPYRHCLGNALVNAELLRIFMKPKHNILMANYWQFVNEYWGLITNGFEDDAKKLYNPYRKRPNSYVFELYRKHFGNILLEADVKCESYDINWYKPLKTIFEKIMSGTLVKNNLLDAHWEIRKLPGIDAEEKDEVLEIDFRAPVVFNYYHAVRQAEVEPNTYYKLSGYIKTEDLRDSQGVCLEVQDSRGWPKTNFAAATARVQGTTDWQYAEVILQTLPDATSVTVYARRIGEEDQLKGKAFFKDVRLEKFIPSLDSRIPYLSVNASRNKEGSGVYLMVVNKNLYESITSTIEIKDFFAGKNVQVWILNGPGIDATNEKEQTTVRVKHTVCRTASSEQGKVSSFLFTFEPHSLTAIEIREEATLSGLRQKGWFCC